MTFFKACFFLYPSWNGQGIEDRNEISPQLRNKGVGPWRQNLGAWLRHIQDSCDKVSRLRVEVKRLGCRGQRGGFFVKGREGKGEERTRNSRRITRISRATRGSRQLNFSLISSTTNGNTGLIHQRICIHVPAIMSNTVIQPRNGSFYVYHKAAYQIPCALISFRANTIIDWSINVQEDATVWLPSVLCRANIDEVINHSFPWLASRTESNWDSDLVTRVTRRR